MYIAMEATMNIKRNLLIVSLLIVLVLPTSFAFAAGIEDVKGVNYTHCAGKEFFQAKSGGYSGDDLYDSAADLSGTEVNYVINFPCAEASADQLSSWSFSGDDAYDPAVLDVPGSSEALSSGSFSGDDNYDLAAGAVL